MLWSRKSRLLLSEIYFIVEFFNLCVVQTELLFLSKLHRLNIVKTRVKLEILEASPEGIHM